MADSKQAKFDPTLRIGVHVRDELTKIEGLVSSCTHHLSGVVQWCVQPPSDDKTTMKDGYNIDGDTLTVLGNGIADKATKAPKKIPVALGDWVEDTVTNFKGTATSMVVCFNGCVLIGVSPQITGKEMFNDKPKESFVDYKRLKVLQSTETAAPVPENVKKQGDVYRTPPDGGPMQRVSANKVVRM